MDPALHRIEALPGASRYAATFRHGDGSEVTAIVQLTDHPEVAAASLPVAWRDGPPLEQLLGAVRAFDAAGRAVGSRVGQLRDVEGGWDVSLGNVVLGSAGVPECTAHGPLEQRGDRYLCTECGAAADLAEPT